MLRKIITIDQEKCNGCGLCAAACHEQAIGMIDGKATLLRDDYCDGLGDCLPVCPTNAISFEPSYCTNRLQLRHLQLPILSLPAASCANGQYKSNWSTRTPSICRAASC